jgi:hypothetical protein
MDTRIEIKDLAREQVLTEIIAERDAIIIQMHRRLLNLTDQNEKLQAALDKMTKPEA